MSNNLPVNASVSLIITSQRLKYSANPYRFSAIGKTITNLSATRVMASNVLFY
jgi:hypothetical protein